MEFCAEVDSKMNEYQWLRTTGSCLADCESGREESNHVSELPRKLDEMENVWTKLNNDTKGEVEKVKNIIKVSIVMNFLV